MVNTDTLGMVYPVVFGAPGGIVPATPALRVYETVAGNYFVIAGHHVAATSVILYNMTQEEDPLPGDAYAPINTEDDLGNKVAMIGPVPPSGGGFGTVHAIADNEYAVAWDPATGGGVRHRGRAIEGLGDLLQWGADTLSVAVHDQGEMAARRSSLNRFRIGGFINELDVVWQEWLESNVLNLFEIEQVEGPRGVYFQEIRHRADRRHVRAKLVTGAGRGGYRVERISAVMESDEEIYNRILVSYGPLAGSKTQYYGTAVMGAFAFGSGDGEERPAPSVLQRDPRCSYSERMFGPRELHLETGIVWEEGTATLLAQIKAARHAIPKLLASYRGGRELLDLRRHDVVEIYDTSPGAVFSGDLAIVTGLSIVDGSTVGVDLAIDTDPFHSPTVQA
jgi:hypothetical protein